MTLLVSGRERKALGHHISLILLITELLVSFNQSKGEVVRVACKTNVHINGELHNVRRAG